MTAPLCRVGTREQPSAWNPASERESQSTRTPPVSGVSASAPGRFGTLERIGGSSAGGATMARLVDGLFDQTTNRYAVSLLMHTLATILMNRIRLSIFLIICIFPTIAAAGDTEAGFIMLGVLFCIPSLVAFIVCLVLLWQYAKRAEQNLWLVVIAPLALIPFGITFTSYGAPMPLWSVLLWLGKSHIQLWPAVGLTGFAYAIYGLRRIQLADAANND
ncbi:MAG: hypothetical protein ABI411_16935 [Tahibacter sp.]